MAGFMDLNLHKPRWEKGSMSQAEQMNTKLRRPLCSCSLSLEDGGWKALWSFCKMRGWQPHLSNRPTGEKTDCCIITDLSAGFSANQKGIYYSCCGEVIFTEIQILQIHFRCSTWSDSHRYYHNESHTTESALCYYHIRSSTRGQQIREPTEAKVCSLWMHLQAQQRESTASGDRKCFARRYICVFVCVCNAISGWLHPLPQYLKVRSLRRPAHDHNHSPQHVECGSTCWGECSLSVKWYL